jgi:hypothetical protein
MSTEKIKIRKDSHNMAKTNIRKKRNPDGSALSCAAVQVSTGKIIEVKLIHEDGSIDMTKPINEFKKLLLKLIGKGRYAILSAENFCREDEFEIEKDGDKVIPNYDQSIFWARIGNYFNETTFILLYIDTDKFAIRLSMDMVNNNLVAKIQVI